VNDGIARDAEASSGPGPMLRRAREARGLTEQQAAELLTLDVTVVSALERDDLEALGAPVFAKGHLRRYGAMLGIVEGDLLAAYERAGHQPETPTLVPKSRQEMMPVRGRPKWPWVVGGTLLFVLAAGLAAYVSEYGLRWPAGPQAESAPTQGATAAAPPSETTSGPAAAPEAPAAGQRPAGGEPAQADAALLPVPPGHVSLGLSFAADSWAEIYDGSGKSVLYDLGRAGTQRTIAAAAPLSVTFGNAPAVTLVVNGRPVAMPPLPAGQTVARLRIEADGTVH
jgi:cytoskeleton protein RodZ